MEKPNLFSLFFTHNFYHIANNATNKLSASNFMILLFHIHLLYDWFTAFTNKYNIELICKYSNISQLELDKLCLPVETGWKHWNVYEKC